MEIKTLGQLAYFFQKPLLSQFGLTLDYRKLSLD
jgi:hypothetical protein